MPNYYLKQRNSDPPAWCPFELPNIVVTGMVYLGDEPPDGINVGQFWYGEDGLEVLLEQSAMRKLGLWNLWRADKCST